MLPRLLPITVALRMPLNNTAVFDAVSSIRPELCNSERTFVTQRVFQEKVHQTMNISGILFLQSQLAGAGKDNHQAKKMYRKVEASKPPCPMAWYCQGGDLLFRYVHARLLMLCIFERGFGSLTSCVVAHIAALPLSPFSFSSVCPLCSSLPYLYIACS